VEYLLRVSRRLFISGALAGAAAAAFPPAFAQVLGEGPIDPSLVGRARDALERHRDRIVHRDLIGIADFSLPSSVPRFHLLNTADGRVKSHLVAHGRGSDPSHTGWLERFSNEPHSYATSAGAYLTDHQYIGGHGESIRLEGLDASNCNAAARGIVVHGAWYVSEAMARDHGVLGRSEGCFALAPSSLHEILAALGPGRLIYADKV
jgi:L,D-transpeptidase catalytic domain